MSTSAESTPTTTTALAIASSADNVGIIVRKTPESFEKNQRSHDNCLLACEQLLADIQARGMNDELDQKAAKYLEKTRGTVKAMNERRAPVTQLFDRVRKEFTALENDIDPTKAGTIPYQLQQLRNQYAAKRREEEEARRRAEEARKAAEQARTQYLDACTEDYKAKFNELVTMRINELTDLNAKVTLDTYQAVYDTVSAYAVELPADWCPASGVRQPYNLTPEEARQIREESLRRLFPQFGEQYRYEISEYRQDILDKLPSKRTELDRVAKASAEEAERIKAEMARREAAEAARKEAERKLREEEEARQAEMKKAGATATNLFDLAQASAPAYQPKAKVTKKIDVIAASGYMQVVSLWWAKEGSGLSKEELDKIFKKQITFCEKLANKEDLTINDPGIRYVEEVKAK